MAFSWWSRNERRLSPIEEYRRDRQRQEQPPWWQDSGCGCDGGCDDCGG